MARQALGVLVLFQSLLTFSYARSVLDKRDVVVSSRLPVNWTYTGCYTDQQFSPTLSGAMYQNGTAMTQKSCILFCATKGFIHSGVEYSSQCFCGNDDLSTATNVTASDCSYACSGNSSEACGAGNRLNVFTSNQTATSPVTSKGIGLWVLYGCYKEGINGRTLTMGMNVPGGANNVTVDLCINACQASGYVLSGVENAGECYCGNQFSNQGQPASDGYKGCNMPCNGNATELCGGADHLDVYGYNNTVPNPLVTTTSSTTSTTISASPSSSSSSSIRTTTSTSSQSSAAPAIVAASNSQSSTPRQGSSTPSASSTTRSASASTSTSSRSASINSTTKSTGASSSTQSSTSTSSSSIQKLTSSTSSSSSSIPTSTVSSTSSPPAASPKVSAAAAASSSTSSIVSAASATPSWYAAGCWTDAVGSRTLNYQQYGNANIMTPELCMSECASGGYNISGVEYYSECYCDTQIRNGGVLATDPTTCNYACNGNSNEICGGSNRLSLYKFGVNSVSSSSSSSSTTYSTSTTSATFSAAASAVPAWSYLGCYVDSVNARTLGNAIYGNANVMTVELCQSSCKSGGYTLSGVEYSGECYCDTALRNGGGVAPDGSVGCNMACNGNASETCGGGNRLNLYSFVVPVASSSSSSPSTQKSTSTTSMTSSSSTSSASATPTAGWTSMGCYNDSVNARTLANPQYGNNDIMTVELCQSECKSAGYTLSGVEYGGECYCDNSFQNYGAPITDGCTMACHWPASEICGGGNRLNVYYYGVISASSKSTSVTLSTTSSSISSSASSTVSTSSSISTSLSSSISTTSSSAAASSTVAIGWYPLGCYVDSVGARTLANGMQVTGGANAMTVEACTSVCLAAKYTLAGVEYSGECYCDNALRNNGGPAPDGNLYCNMACNGNSTEICGGSNRLSLYSYQSTVSSSTTSSTTAISGAAISTSSSSSSSTSSAVTGLPSGWKYDGCYIDNANGRIMLNQQNDNQQLTVESCVQTCISLGYSVAGMEYSVQCFCDNYIRNGAALSPADTDCGNACSGNSREKCGGGNRVSVYNIGNLTVYQPPAVQNASLPGNWTYKGCLTDNADARTFPYRIVNMINNNTATNCLSLCSQFGYPAGGMEFGSECYCGDFSDITNAGATLAPDSDCNMACSGDPTTVCGAGSRISYYAWSGTPLYTWNRPTGTAAGQYEFLIGGVIIPLITSQTIKGKVIFVEKFGTEPANNSTGAYELDLAEINNFTAAWRPMHVKTDVFCSAGLTLPDKAGRQINIGGWANDATYGIRLYWPDGSPGVAGVNDWQENVNEVALQNGRWYPSAMIMANGSILVVGGEEGSNGAPVPTLELLPASGGVLYCDWLDRTDPYNLYPFLAVLPSGGIFVAYYNEARILDEGNLQTSRTLPNMPGAVNDFDGGRTYPFEGTAALMPQYAPYGDPLTVLVCGGSTPGPEIALDNCVSIQPEVKGASWTIERMPSKRVISCMTALPDGTYLILNGGQQGRAGFGLAIDPNHNAVLYDPSQPVNQRMSVMANTTIDRLYHSEAILLQDGRVLVSGSDPEDTRFVQEYRVEVFLPPYLLSGLPRPMFTVSNTDWGYGQAIQVTVTSGNTANMRASLLGADSSTHGNSMGQRTIFPAISCSGNTCTITAPPNSHVCPPGWFQLFLLDGPTPSKSNYVRIGGDPGSLGNWPNYPDFHPLPGV